MFVAGAESRNRLRVIRQPESRQIYSSRLLLTRGDVVVWSSGFLPRYVVTQRENALRWVINLSIWLSESRLTMACLLSQLDLLDRRSGPSMPPHRQRKKTAKAGAKQQNC